MLLLREASAQLSVAVLSSAILMMWLQHVATVAAALHSAKAKPHADKPTAACLVLLPLVLHAAAAVALT
jgi:hypothetical protein